MSNVQEYACFLKQHFHPQLVFPELANQLGLDESIVLQQVHYWLEKGGKSIDGSVWIYNTYDQWKEQFTYWSVSKIKRIFYALEKAELIISKKINVHKSNHTKWYSINYKKLYELMKGMLSKKVKQQKKFASFKNELSSSQIDTIINTDNNYTNNICLSNKANPKVETNLHAKEQLIKQTDRNFLELKKEEKVICEQMIEVWQQVFINSDEKIILTAKRATKLYQVWKKFCDGNIEKWREICLAANSSKFLMGEKDTKFKAYFDWLISENTINRIIAGDFNIGDRIPDIKQVERQLEAEKAKEIYVTKQKAERLMEEEKQRKAEIERVAQNLANAELEKIEANWTEEDQSKAKKSFEDFLRRGGEGNPYFKDISEDFQKYGRFTYPIVAIDFFFKEFKILNYLEKSWDEFLKEAEILLNSKESTNREIESNIAVGNQEVISCEARNKEKSSIDNKIKITECNEESKDLEFELEIVARQLAEEELTAVEASWTNADKVKAIDEFEDFLLRGAEGNVIFAHIVENFRKRDWVQQNKTLLEAYFKEFKIIKYLRKSWEEFKIQVKPYCMLWKCNKSSAKRF